MVSKWRSIMLKYTSAKTRYLWRNLMNHFSHFFKEPTLEKIYLPLESRSCILHLPFLKEIIEFLLSMRQEKVFKLFHCIPEKWRQLYLPE